MENRRGKDDKVSRRVWKAVEAKAVEVRVVKAKRRGKKRKKKERIREEEEERKEERKEIKKDKSEESNRRMGNLGQEGRGSKIRGRSENKWIHIFSKKASK